MVLRIARQGIHPLFMNPPRGTGIWKDTFSIDMLPLGGEYSSLYRAQYNSEGMPFL
jgi:hypothetical protein